LTGKKRIKPKIGWFSWKNWDNGL